MTSKEKTPASDRGKGTGRGAASIPIDSIAQTNVIRQEGKHLAWGFSPIPIEAKGKRPPLDGAHRFKWGQYQQRHATPQELVRWCAKFGDDRNTGIATGQVSGCIVVDVDAPEAQTYIDQHGLPETPSVETGKGAHYYLKRPKRARVKNATDLGGIKGLDIRADGGYTVAPGSVHESGAVYAWLLSPEDTPLAECPRWLLDLLSGKTKPTQQAPQAAHVSKDGNKPYVDGALRDELGRLALATEGHRNHALNAAAFALGQFCPHALDRHDLEGLLLSQALAIGLPEHEAIATINSGITSGMLQPREIPPPKVPPVELDTPVTASDDGHDPAPAPGRPPIHNTDLGNARRLVKQHGRDVHYCHQTKEWFVWDKRIWSHDHTGMIERRAIETVSTIYAEAGHAHTPEARKAIADWAKTSESRYRRRQMIEDAKDIKPVPIRATALDADPWLLSCENGTIDLKTGELQPHHRGDLISKIVPVHYDAAATCPQWITFLRDILPDPQLRAYVARAVGYSLTGDVREDCLFFSYGRGRNGKSTFFETIMGLFGPYSQKVETQTLMEARRRAGAASPDILLLKGARFVVAAEVGQGQRLNESLVKDLCGGDRLVGRALYSNQYVTFEPSHALWIYGNHKPEIKETTEAIWRRVKLLPFVVTISKDKENKAMPEILRSELPGILQWAIRGCLDWQAEGLGDPEAVKDATTDYKNEMDVIRAFLAECCIENETATVRAGELYKAYRQWCEDNGEHCDSSTQFGRELTARGYDKVKTTHVNYIGLGLLND